MLEKVSGGYRIDPDFGSFIKKNEDISQVTQEVFKDYRNYATLFGLLDPLFWEHYFGIKDYKPTLNVASEWYRHASAGPVLGPAYGWNKFYDDLIFLARSTIKETLESNTDSQKIFLFPMFNHLKVKFPNSSKLNPGSALGEAFDLNQFTGGYKSEGRKIDPPPLDHSYLSRLAQHNDEGVTPAYRSFSAENIEPDSYWSEFSVDNWVTITPKKTAASLWTMTADQGSYGSLDFPKFFTNFFDFLHCFIWNSFFQKILTFRITSFNYRFKILIYY